MRIVDRHAGSASDAFGQMSVQGTQNFGCDALGRNLTEIYGLADWLGKYGPYNESLAKLISGISPDDVTPP